MDYEDYDTWFGDIRKGKDYKKILDISNEINKLMVESKAFPCVMTSANTSCQSESLTIHDIRKVIDDIKNMYKEESIFVTEFLKRYGYSGNDFDINNGDVLVVSISDIPSDFDVEKLPSWIQVSNLVGRGTVLVLNSMEYSSVIKTLQRY